MARSNKPWLWLPFAVGGTAAAFLLPALVLVTLGASTGILAHALDYEPLRAFFGHWLVSLIAFGVIAAMLWHAAHRLRMTLQDIAFRSAGPRALSAGICYTLAALLTVALALDLILLV